MRRLAPAVAALTALIAACSTGSGAAPAPSGPAASGLAATSPAGSGQSISPSTRATNTPGVWVDPTSVGQLYPGSVGGMLTFRGNPTRTFYGTGPVPKHPRILWRYPGAPMCSSVPYGDAGDHSMHTWCGQGWTGEPAVFERGGHTWEIFGAYDSAYHFLDATTGRPMLPDLKVGDLVKGAVSVDPDGYPFVYTGANDNFLRVISFQGSQPHELWSLNAEAVSPTLWNNDWDSSPLEIGDYLFEGGEDSQFFIIKLNRGYLPNGTAVVNPQLVFHAPGWDDQQLRDLGDQMLSIENSLAISGNTVYFANSGGLVQGWDISGLKKGVPPHRVFRFWTGDDTDGGVVVDEKGFLYVGSEQKRHDARQQQVGTIFKLDPRKPDNPIVWAIHDQGGGTWSNAGLYRGLLIVPTRAGHDYGIDRETGKVLWIKNLPGETVSSPVIVDGVWIQSDCTGSLRAYDLAGSYPNEPKELWSVHLSEGCIESTPAVWNGRLYVGTRAGYDFAVGDG